MRFPVAPPEHDTSFLESNGAVAQRGERFDGIEEVAGASPAGSTTTLIDRAGRDRSQHDTSHHITRASSNSRTTVFQTENEGAIPSARSAQPQHPLVHVSITCAVGRYKESALVLEPILRRGLPSATRCVRVQLPLGSLQVTNGSRRVGYPGLSDKEPALRSIRR